MKENLVLLGSFALVVGIILGGLYLESTDPNGCWNFYNIFCSR